MGKYFDSMKMPVQYTVSPIFNLKAHRFFSLIIHWIGKKIPKRVYVAISTEFIIYYFSFKDKWWLAGANMEEWGDIYLLNVIASPFVTSHHTVE